MTAISVTDRATALSSIDRVISEIDEPLERMRTIYGLQGLGIASSPPTIQISQEGLGPSTGEAALIQVASELRSAVTACSKRAAGDVVEISAPPLPLLREAVTLLSSALADIGNGEFVENVRFSSEELDVPIYVNLWGAGLGGAPSLTEMARIIILDRLGIPDLDATFKLVTVGQMARISRIRGRLERIRDLSDRVKLALEIVEEDSVPDNGEPAEDCSQIIAAIQSLVDAIRDSASPPSRLELMNKLVVIEEKIDGLEEPAYAIAEVIPTYPRSPATRILTIRWAKHGALRRQKQLSIPGPRNGLSLSDIPGFQSGAALTARLVFQNNQAVEISLANPDSDWPDRMAALCSEPPRVYRIFPAVRPAAIADWHVRGATVADRTSNWEQISPLS